MASAALQALKARRQGAQAESASASASLHAQDAIPPPEVPKAERTVWGFAWTCEPCRKECIPIRSESRCLCGHRLKEHAALGSLQDTARCKSAKCKCPGFFYIVAEGAWILRCSCKHKHVEHDPATHKCSKSGCSCEQFTSPWVCNCDHPWTSHTQRAVQKQVKSLADMMDAASLQEVLQEQAGSNEINRFDLVRRGRDA